MAIRAVIFDLDGTLVDTIGDLTASLNYGLAGSGLDGITVERCRELVGNGVRRLCSGAIPDEKQEFLEDVIASMREHYIRNYADRTYIYPGVSELLDELSKRNIFLSVLTNKVEDAARDIAVHYFGSWNLSPVYGAVDGRELKPSPVMLHKILNELNLTQEDALYVGDSEVDIATARNAGVAVAAVSWGFRDREGLLELGPDFMVDKPLELLELLDKT